MHMHMHMFQQAAMCEQAAVWRDTWMGELGESSKHKPRKTPVVLFSRRGRGRDALGCSVMHVLSNYLQPYQEEARLASCRSAQRYAVIKIRLDKYISVMITSTDPYATLINHKPQTDPPPPRAITY